MAVLRPLGAGDNDVHVVDPVGEEGGGVAYRRGAVLVIDPSVMA